MPVAGRHPDAERLAEYVDRVLTAEDRADVERHLAVCADCREVVADTVAVLADTPQTTHTDTPRVVPFRTRRWVTGVAASLAAAAVLVLAVRVVRPQWLGFGSASDRVRREALVAAVASEPTRPVEGRLTGGFPYAPVRPVTRGPGDGTSAPDVTIAAAEIEKATGERPPASDRALLGVAYLVVGDADKAIASLEAAIEQMPNQASFHSDLSAALLERGRRRGNADDWSRALSEAERALALQPDAPEARFNRALALDYLRQRDRAVDAWTACANQPDGPWQDECRRRLAALAR